METTQIPFNPDIEVSHILRFIRNYVSNSGTSGVAVAISGGIDSAVASLLAVKALGKDKVLGLLLFEDGPDNLSDYEDAKLLISRLKINSKEISISPLFYPFKTAIKRAGIKASKYTLGNIKARCRMILLYAFANQNNLLVLGTGDRSEEEIGYFTKWGDGGVDLQPIAHLYKTQVRLLGEKLGVPDRVVNKPSSPHLWEGHEAIDEIPADYPVLDRILNLLYDESMRPGQVAKRLRVSRKLVNDIISLHDRNYHKRIPPPSLFGDSKR